MLPHLNGPQRDPRAPMFQMWKGPYAERKMALHADNPRIWFHTDSKFLWKSETKRRERHAICVSTSSLDAFHNLDAREFICLGGDDFCGSST